MNHISHDAPVGALTPPFTPDYWPPPMSAPPSPWPLHQIPVPLVENVSLAGCCRVRRRPRDEAGQLHPTAAVATGARLHILINGSV